MTTDEIKVDAQYFAAQFLYDIDSKFEYADDDEVVDFHSYFKNPIGDYEEYDEMSADEQQMFKSTVLAEFKEMIYDAAEKYGFNSIDWEGTKFQKIQ